MQRFPELNTDYYPQEVQKVNEQLRKNKEKQEITQVSSIYPHRNFTKSLAAATTGILHKGHKESIKPNGKSNSIQRRYNTESSS